MSRRGTLLVVVAGLCALMAAMGLAFLARMRDDGEESARVSQDIQARVMLSAGLMYVQETARLGWDDETFGWRDIRDGLPGPRGFDGDWPPPLKGLMLADGTAVGGHGAFPAIGGRAARSPMYVMKRPPYAVRATLAPNPVPLGDPADAATASLPWAQLIGYTVADPQPLYRVPDTASAAAKWDDFRLGDPAPRDPGAPPPWFRVYRQDAITFILTCGAGASLGYRDWQEVVDDGAQATFGSQAGFDAIRQDESIAWYEAQWTDRVTGNHFFHGFYGAWDQRQFGDISAAARDTPNMRQFVGTFTYIERRLTPPAAW